MVFSHPKLFSIISSYLRSVSLTRTVSLSHGTGNPPQVASTAATAGARWVRNKSDGDIKREVTRCHMCQEPFDTGFLVKHLRACEKSRALKM
jgi:hypothetical protein